MGEENKFKTPTIKINGKIIRPQSPKMKAWRKFLEFYEKDETELQSMSLAEYTDIISDLIVVGFNRDEVTKETLEENLSVAEFRNLYKQLSAWLQRIFFTGIEEIPNAEAEITLNTQV